MQTHHCLGACALVLVVRQLACAQTAPDQGVKPAPPPPAGRVAEAKLADEDPAERVIETMRVVQQRIETRDTGRETRELQNHILDDLQKLIDLARKQGPSNPQPNTRPDPADQQAAQPDRRKPSQEPDRQPEGSANPNPAGDDERQDSSERTDEARQNQIELARRRALAQQVWGHLPPNLRQKVLNIFSEDSLPQYSDLVRHYFESLGEPETKP